MEVLSSVHPSVTEMSSILFLRRHCKRGTMKPRTLVREHLKIYPQGRYRYTASLHRGTFSNGSTIEFGYCDAESDVYRYQGAEYDTIRFDELTHF